MNTPDNQPVSQFQNGQRVRILPNRNYPKIKSVRYGIIQGSTQHAGMHLMNEDRTNEAGEWAYIVASYHHPKAGAMWYTASGLEPMRRERKPNTPTNS